MKVLSVKYDFQKEDLEDTELINKILNHLNQDNLMVKSNWDDYYFHFEHNGLRFAKLSLGPGECNLTMSDSNWYILNYKLVDSTRVALMLDTKIKKLRDVLYKTKSI